MGICRQSAKILCQDKIYTQPLSFLTPLYTEVDKDGKCPPLTPTDSAPGLGLDSEFGDMSNDRRDKLDHVGDSLGTIDQTTTPQMGSRQVANVNT